jgi:catechol 2,3-dioxygenase-like lactoylglutathione lyase family enzyme
MPMNFELRRIIIFTANMAAMSRFYGETLGLELAGQEEGWLDYKAGACNIALHKGNPKLGGRPPKIAFYAANVAAARALLVARGVKTLGKILSIGQFDMCNGTDPDGNPFSISSRT